MQIRRAIVPNVTEYISPFVPHRPVRVHVAFGFAAVKEDGVSFANRNARVGHS